jgi:hypothetical protein
VANEEGDGEALLLTEHGGWAGVGGGGGFGMGSDGGRGGGGWLAGNRVDPARNRQQQLPSGRLGGPHGGLVLGGDGGA